MIANVYLPPQQQGDETSQLQLLQEPFSIEIVPPAAALMSSAAVAPTTTAPTATAAPTLTPAPAIGGNTDLVPSTSDQNASLRIVYSTPDLFSVIVLKPIDLSDLSIASLRSEDSLLSMFDVLKLSGAEAQHDMCLHFVRYVTHAPKPIDCDARQNFQRVVQDTDVFWYDFNRDQLLHTVIRNTVAKTTLGFCSGTDQGGCDF